MLIEYLASISMVVMVAFLGAVLMIAFLENPFKSKVSFVIIWIGYVVMSSVVAGVIFHIMVGHKL